MLEAKNLHVVDGPLVRQKLKVLRDEDTRTPEFRQAMKELALIVVAEATHSMPTNTVRVRTPSWTSMSSPSGNSARPSRHAIAVGRCFRSCENHNIPGA